MDILGKNAITTAAGSTDLAVAGVTTIYSKAIYVGLAKFFALSYKAVSALAAVNLKIEVEQSFQLPTTEGAADDYWKEPVGMADIVGALTMEDTWYHAALPLIPLPYMRLKIMGGAGNAADAIVTAILSKQEAC